MFSLAPRPSRAARTAHAARTAARRPSRLAMAAAALLAPVVVIAASGAVSAPVSGAASRAGQATADAAHAASAVVAGAAAAPLQTHVVADRAAGRRVTYDGTVEAVRQTVLAAQTAGTVQAVLVRAGDRVRAGQVLLRLDARAAEQQAGAAAAQVLAARAAQDAATAEFARQQQLFQMEYISRAALERAEAQYKAATAQSAAQLAAAGAARTEAGYAVIRAPYDGVVSDLPVVVGDMAMPGRPLATVFDPAALRVAVVLPESMAAVLADGPPAGAAPAAPSISIEIAGRPDPIAPARTQLLPAADPATHTLLLRLDLPRGTAVAPGQFARVSLPGSARAEERVFVPARAVVRRAELQAVYVLDAEGRALLRQVRVGPAQGEQVEILAGLRGGERIALDPHAAARQPGSR